MPAIEEITQNYVAELFLRLLGKVTYYNGIDTEGYGVPAIVDDVSLTAQSAVVAPVNFTNGQVAGTYRVDYTFLCTTLDGTAGSLQVDFAWTDGAGAATATSGALSLTALGRVTGSFHVQSTGAAFTYGTSVVAGAINASEYALYITCERIS